MTIFGERLKGLRLEENLSQQQLANQTGLPRTSIRYWELGKREPSLSSVIILAKFFDVSIDYLVGLN